MNKLVVQTDQAPAAIGPYSQAIQAGNLLFVSGQIPLNFETGQLVSGTIEEETHRVMKNLEAILKAAGAGFQDVVKATLFIKDMNDFSKINEVYASYYHGSFPARETVEVSRLPRDARIEISIVAGI